MNIYCISGLGVDKRAFNTINLPGFEMVFVDWIPPNKKEDLTSYAKRLFQIEKPTADSIFMGVSFGGMIAQEWSKIQTPKKLILISTTDHFSNIRPSLRIPGKLGLHRILHPKIALLFTPLTYYFFGAKSNKDKQMLKRILRDMDPTFFRWATGALLQWKTEKRPNALRIHGNKDRMIAPSRDVKYFTSGGHFTIFSDGREISQFLTEHLA